MHIVIGEHAVKRKLGWTVEFCCVCRGPSCVKVSQLRLLPHLNFIPIWFSRAVGFESKCGACGALYGYERASERQYSRRLPKDLDEFLLSASPEVARFWNDRELLEHRARRGDLNEQERVSLLLEPLRMLEYMSRVNLQSPPIPLRKVLLFLVFLCFSGAAIWSHSRTSFGAATVCLTILSVASLLVTVRGASKKSLTARVVAPFVARSIAPLNPTDAELEHVLMIGRERAIETARCLKARQLSELVKAERDRCTLRINDFRQTRTSVAA